MLFAELVRGSPIEHFGRVAMQAQSIGIFQSGNTAILFRMLVQDRERVVFADDTAGFLLDRFGGEVW